MIDTKTLLEKCPQCGAWPMAAKPPRPWNQPEVRFRCTKCGHQECASFIRAGSIRHHSRPPVQSAREAPYHG